MAITTKEDILQEISNGNLNPKILTDFFSDMKIKSFAYDYLIQKDLVHYKTRNFTLDPNKMKTLRHIFDKTTLGIEYEFPFEILAIGMKAYYKRSEVYNVAMDYSTISKNTKFFRNNPIVFVDGEIFLGYRMVVKNDTVKFYFSQADLHEMAIRHRVSYAPDAIVTDVKIVFVPNAFIDVADDLTAGMIAGNNLDARNFDSDLFIHFNEIDSFMGFWIHKTTGNHFMDPYITWNKENKFFSLSHYPPTDISQYKLMVVGTNAYKQYVDVTPEDVYYQFTTEQMPIPKDNLMILIKRNDLDVFTPNDGSITVDEYYPNIYKINNPDGKFLRIVVLSIERAYNEHICYDNEIKPYMKRIDLLNAYKNESVPELIKDFSPVKWLYSIYDYLVSIGEIDPEVISLSDLGDGTDDTDNPSDTPEPTEPSDIDDMTQISELFDLERLGGWGPFLYKMDTISSVLKKWFYFYEEYIRRTYGYLSGWYHNIATYDNMEEKIRNDTSQETSAVTLQYTFDEPQYVFSYKNNSVFGTVKSYMFYIDGKYTIPTRILVDHGYQFVYFPVSKIKEDSVIEVERFDGITLNMPLELTEEGVKVEFGKVARTGTIANCLFLVDAETQKYLTKDDVQVFVTDPDVGRIYIDLATSVYAIGTNMTLEFIPSEEYVGKTVRLCCNNKTFQFFAHEDGQDFVKGYQDIIDLNQRGFIASVNKSVMPRLRIYTEDGRLIPKRCYDVFKHDKYTDKPRFQIPIWADKSITFMVAYTGYDERLIYHREEIPPNGYVTFEGRTSRPFSFKYHDIYLDGYRLTKYDVEVISPYAIVITSMEKFDTDSTLEIYEKTHVNDRFVKFAYDEKSEFIMDKILQKEEQFRKYLENVLPKYTPSGETEHVDMIADEWYDFWRYYLPYRFLNGNMRYDLEAYHHCFGNGRFGRILLNADDRVKYQGIVYAIFYFSHDLELEEGNKEPPATEDDENMLIVDESIEVPEDTYKYEGYRVNYYNPVYDDPYDVIVRPDEEPTEEDPDATRSGNRYLPDSEFPHVPFDGRYPDGKGRTYTASNYRVGLAITDENGNEVAQIIPETIHAFPLEEEPNPQAYDENVYVILKD